MPSFERTDQVYWLAKYLPSWLSHLGNHAPQLAKYPVIILALLDTDTRPSQAPERKEVVVLMLEDHSRNATVMLPILRDAAGVFTGFGDSVPCSSADHRSASPE